MKPHWTHITFNIGIYAGLALGMYISWQRLCLDKEMEMSETIQFTGTREEFLAKAREMMTEEIEGRGLKWRLVGEADRFWGEGFDENGEIKAISELAHFSETGVTLLTMDFSNG